MTLNLPIDLLIELLIANNIVFRSFRTNPLLGAYPQYGYASLGFKDISVYAQKYGDRSLYTSSLKRSPSKASPSKACPSKEKDLENNLENNAHCDLIQSFSVQKAGNTPTECEDIWHFAKCNARVSIALSDGATESSFAREWAKELVTAFVNRRCPWQEIYSCAANWLGPLQINWQQWLAHQNLSWFAKRKAGAGAFATFLSLEVFPNLSWRSLAVGDSCLFIVRDRRLHKSFPLQNSQEFSNCPKLIGTHGQAANMHMSQIQGEAKIGDRFYLTTDAIACWILKQIEANQDPWVKLEEIDSQASFAEWVTELRDRRDIANDDTTLLCLQIQETYAAPMPQNCES
ncbi:MULTISPECIES: hypothetical protein [Pseudanabaena]|uniref:PPM-type phosphatase domain-containing protein n=2 Tax=Pseudanabaena TaxID=1152 RepID=L8MVH8_9CYAN|nr:MULTISPECIES: hypothetical protein [Pseudanabaena]ELS31962.1 hypothetical protein Pse7429DRAFT_3026 [Pseudanabaena biceps PCC 7429]MDG3495790.1 hypothetical protein [Pseudanabaena catenata USMAC16]